MVLISGISLELKGLGQDSPMPQFTIFFSQNIIFLFVRLETKCQNEHQCKLKEHQRM